MADSYSLKYPSASPGDPVAIDFHRVTRCWWYSGGSDRALTQIDVRLVYGGGVWTSCVQKGLGSRVLALLEESARNHAAGEIYGTDRELTVKAISNASGSAWRVDWLGLFGMCVIPLTCVLFAAWLVAPKVWRGWRSVMSRGEVPD